MYGIAFSAEKVFYYTADINDLRDVPNPCGDQNAFLKILYHKIYWLISFKFSCIFGMVLFLVNVIATVFVDEIVKPWSLVYETI